MSAETLLSRLEGVRRTGPGTWRARCPGHDSKSLTLSIKETDDGRTLVHCFAECSVEQVVGAVGLKLEDLFPPRPAEHSPRLREPFPARDVLACLDDEALIVCITACDVCAGITPTDADRERLLVAYERIAAARRLHVRR